MPLLLRFPRSGRLTRTEVGHILRALATNHWMREVRPGVFANNRVSSLLDSGKTVEQLKNSYVVPVYARSVF